MLGREAGPTQRDEAIAAYQKALETETHRDFAYTGDPVTISHGWIQDRLTEPYTLPEA